MGHHGERAGQHRAQVSGCCCCCVCVCVRVAWSHPPAVASSQPPGSECLLPAPLCTPACGLPRPVHAPPFALIGRRVWRRWTMPWPLWLASCVTRGTQSSSASCGEAAARRAPDAAPVTAPRALARLAGRWLGAVATFCRDGEGEAGLRRLRAGTPNTQHSIPVTPLAVLWIIHSPC